MLGLAPDDVRERNRQHPNAEIRDAYLRLGANEGTPNDALYQHIAQTFTTAVVNGEITLGRRSSAGCPPRCSAAG
ncbi:hypothetical protein ACFQ1S_26300 [Kibdelosporangium lantanae]|uniref:Uncharacterized protein n=1 Tax=Kibdelosporangium lantanae TaxID=1497396 RepID=A0ABW3MFG5_9PSEU